MTGSEITHVDNGEATNTRPKGFELYQNMPNPFNPDTNIKFSIAEPGRTTIRVYNMMGELVETLLDTELNAGGHQINFRADHLYSGVYFYKIQSDHFSEMKKMILLQ